MAVKNIRHILQWCLGITLIAAIIYGSDITSLGRFPDIQWFFAAGVAFCYIMFTILHTTRWQIIVQGLMPFSKNEKVSFFTYYRWLINSYLVALTIPADVSLAGVRMLYIHKSKVLSPQSALFSVLLDRCLDLIIFLVFAVPSLLFITGILSLYGSMAVLLGIMAALALFVGFKKQKTFSLMLSAYDRVITIVTKVPFIGKKVEKHRESNFGEQSFPGKSVYTIFLWSFAKYFVASLRFFMLGLTFGTDFTFYQAMLLFPVIQSTFLLNITPAGLGVVELGTYGALALMGIEKTKIGTFVLGQRILDTAILLGIFIMTNVPVFMARFREKR